METELSKITDEIQETELCENCKKKLRSLALRLKEAIQKELKSNDFEKQGLMSDVLFQQLEGIAIRTIYDLVVSMERQGSKKNNDA